MGRPIPDRHKPKRRAQGAGRRAQGAGRRAQNIPPSANNITIDGVAGDLSDTASAAATQIAQLVTLKVKEEMATAMRYGGMMRPRGS